jgi:hypothetical protein
MSIIQNGTFKIVSNKVGYIELIGELENKYSEKWEIFTNTAYGFSKNMYIVIAKERGYTGNGTELFRANSDSPIIARRQVISYMNLLKK